MLKYQKILKSILLMTVVSGAVSGAFASGRDAVPFEPIVDEERLGLFTKSKVRGTYLKHQAATSEVQARIHEAKQYWFGVNGEALEYKLKEAARNLAEYNKRLESAKQHQKSKMTAEDKSARATELSTRNLELEQTIKALRGIPKRADALEKELSESEIELANNKVEIASLNTAFEDLFPLIQSATEELERLQKEKSVEAQLERDKLLMLLYAKFRTIYHLPVETTSPEFLDRLCKRYPTSNLHLCESGTIISPLDHIVRLLHGIGVDRDLITDLSAPPSSGRFHPQSFIYKLMMAIEVPDPRFVTEDLPVPYYRRTTAGEYIEETAPPTQFLDAYAFMADYLARAFDLRLREDVATLRTIVEVPDLTVEDGERLGLNENPDRVFLIPGNEVWRPAAVESLRSLWNSGGRSSQDAFNQILARYDDSFRLSSPFLEAAIPANPLGIAYRLLQAAETDIRSWNTTNVPVLDKVRAEGRISDIDFSSIIQRIIGRHVNLCVLQAMADSVRTLITPVTVANGWGSPVGLTLPPKVEEVVAVRTPVPIYPDASECPRVHEALCLGADYDQSTGIVTYPNGHREQIPPKAYVPGGVNEPVMGGDGTLGGHPKFPAHPTRYATEIAIHGWTYNAATGEYKDAWGNVQDRE
ncbi:MAG: hypothetical protein K2Q34_04210 [Alphaproteobacteria bacterium]|nr:hypothetical protein [Alphaproteobacteria bacterium]